MVELWVLFSSLLIEAIVFIFLYFWRVKNFTKKEKNGLLNVRKKVNTAYLEIERAKRALDNAVWETEKNVR